MAYCFFHAPGRRNAHGQCQARKKPLNLSPLVDSAAIQSALGQVLEAIGSSKLSSRSAGQLLFGLRIAADNLRRSGRPPQPEKAGLPPTREPKDDSSKQGA